MFTDTVGSTAHAQSNEREALKLRDEQFEVLRGLFALHHGREVKSTGDGFLAEFDSALRAVQCAVDIQQHLHERNSLPGAPIDLRIGIHLGDVERRDDDIVGDAVNIASRIEPLASPGGICISAEVFSQIRNKISNRFEKLPPTSLKGVHAAIEIYRVVLPWTVRGVPGGDVRTTGIAILPLANISPDPKDEYFADGLTEELITVLSQLRNLRVISRTSVNQYKASTKTLVQIGSELGVAYVLEGSVRKAGNQLRITAQLIDAAADKHLWAKTYDRELDNIFVIQSEIARQVTSALEVELRPTDRARLEKGPAIRPESYLAYLKARVLARGWTHESLGAAVRGFEQAIELDDRNAAAYAGLAITVYDDGLWHGEVADTEWVNRTRSAAERALDLDSNIAEAHLALAYLAWRDADLVRAEQEFRLALSLNPNHADTRRSYGLFLESAGRADEALDEFTVAEGADPLWHSLYFFHGATLVWLSRLDEALPIIERYAELAPPGSGAHALRAEYFRARGNVDAALTELQAGFEEGTPLDRLLDRARYLILAGKKDEARAILQQMSSSAESGQTVYHLAMLSAELGDLDECFRWMERALEQKNLPMQRLRLDPQLEPVRRDPRFRSILHRLNLT